MIQRLPAVDSLEVEVAGKACNTEALGIDRGIIDWGERLYGVAA